VADDRLRELERAHAQDPDDEGTLEALKVARCRSGGCCAHGTYPPLPEAAPRLVDSIRVNALAEHSDVTIAIRGSSAEVGELLTWFRAVGLRPAEEVARADEGNVTQWPKARQLDGDFCVSHVSLTAKGIEVPRGEADQLTHVGGYAATNAVEWVPIPSLEPITLGEGLWQLNLDVRGSGRAGRVRLSAGEFGESGLEVTPTGNHSDSLGWRVRVARYDDYQVTAEFCAVEHDEVPPLAVGQDINGRPLLFIHTPGSHYPPGYPEQIHAGANVLHNAEVLFGPPRDAEHLVPHRIGVVVGTAIHAVSHGVTITVRPDNNDAARTLVRMAAEDLEFDVDIQIRQGQRSGVLLAPRESFARLAARELGRGR